MRGARWLVFVVLAVASRPALALDPHKSLDQYGRDLWQTADGLPQNSIQAIAQTRDGYLWLGTQEGLVRFDGTRFTVFDKGNTPALRSHNVQALLETKDGSLWITTGGGGLTRLKDHVFTTLTTADGLASDLLGPLSEGADGSLWIGTAGQGLDRLKDREFTHYTKDTGLSSNTINALLAEEDGTLWIGTDRGGLDRMLDGRIQVYTTKQGLSSDTIYALARDKQGTLWIGAAKGGLNRLREDRISVLSAKDGFPGDRVDAITEDRDGNLWVGAYGAGLTRLHDGQLSRFQGQGVLASGVPWAIVEDEEGSLWIGTRAGGLHRLKDGRFATYTTADGLPEDLVWAVHPARDGGLWVSTDRSGLVRFRDGRFTRLTTRDGLSHDMTRSLLEAANGDLWVGTWGGGVNRLHAGRITAYTTKEGLSHDVVRALAEDGKGGVWVGTYGGGLDHIENGRVTVYTTASGLSNDTLYCLHLDRQGDLWIGTRGSGIDRFHDGTFTSYTTRDGLPDNVVLSITEDAEGTLWAATRGGLGRLRDGRWRAYTRKDGLLEDAVYQVLEDRSGDLWLSSNRGISRIRRSEIRDLDAGRASALHPIRYGRSDGLRSEECAGGVQPAGARDSDGRLWFPTIAGLSVVDPAQIRTSRRLPRVAVEEVLVNRSVLDPAVTAPVPAGAGELEFHFTALSLAAPEKIQFKYRLLGFDDRWTPAGTRRVAYYTNIPHGAYRFQVAASNDDGVWDEQGASFALRLEPRFYQTRPFRLALLAAILLGAWGLYTLRVARLEARQHELERLVDERTRSLRDAIRTKDDVVSMVAHDFGAPLTVILGYGERLESRAQDEETRQALAAIRAHARRLTALAADILTLSGLEAGQLPLELEDVDLAGLVRGQVEMARRDRGASIVLDGGNDAIVVRGDPHRLKQVIDNLVGNAAKYSPAGSEIRVTVGPAGDQARVAVSDRGAGIPAEEMPRLFQKFSRLDDTQTRRVAGTGLGLYICRSIVEAHGGRIWAESDVGRGSTFSFALPRKEVEAALLIAPVARD